MFRYIGLVWDAVDPGASAAAERIRPRLPAPAWRPALHHPGLQVWVAGERPGGNRAQCMADHRGVILGTVFRRGHLLDGMSTAATLDTSEQQQIVASTGQALIDACWGRYVVLFETPDGTAHLLRDPSGALPCFLMNHEGVWIVFSWLDDVLAAMPHLPRPQASWDGVGAHLLSGAIGGHETALAGITQVLPGEIVHIDRGETRHELLWDPVEVPAPGHGSRMRARMGELLRRPGAAPVGRRGLFDPLRLSRQAPHLCPGHPAQLLLAGHEWRRAIVRTPCRRQIRACAHRARRQHERPAGAHP